MTSLSASSIAAIHPTTDRSEPADPDGLRILEQSLGIPTTSHNAIEVLRNGDEIFPSMLAAIRGARRSIAFITFVYWTGEIAVQFASALAEAARRGVTVLVILDAIGCKSMDKELLERMQNGGVQIRWFRPPRTWKIWRWTHRTHRKVLVVDHRIGFTGGVGIAQEWEGDARDPSQWRDTHFRIEGAAVQGLWGSFVGNWMEINRTMPPGWNVPVQRRRAGDARIQLIRATASIGWSDVATALYALLNLARRRLWIATAYFVPEPGLARLLCDKARANVDVAILVPGPHHDARVTKFAGLHHLQAMLEAGVQVYRYQPTMLHCKLVLVDDDLSMLGSANLNYRWLRKDDEVVLMVDDSRLCATLTRQFREDLSVSEAVRAEDLRRSWWRRALRWVVAPLRSEM